jgi:hypothetical protein
MMANRLDLLLGRRVASALDGRQIDSSTMAAGNGNRSGCANTHCPRSWGPLLKDRRRPIFECDWACSIKCLGALVGAAIRREAGEGPSAETEGVHRHRVPLGLILLSRGWITHAQLRHALDAQRRAGKGRIGAWLIEQCCLEPDLITRALSIQWGCPVLPMEGFDPQAMALVLPRLLADTFGIVPLRVVANQSLYVAFSGQLDAAAAFAIERMSGLKVLGGLSDPAQWQAAQQILYACEFVDTRFERVANVDSMSQRMAAHLSTMQPRASRLVRLHQFYWLRMWMEEGAMRTPGGGLPSTKEDVADRIYTVGREQ